MKDLSKQCKKILMEAKKLSKKPVIWFPDGQQPTTRAIGHIMTIKK